MSILSTLVNTEPWDVTRKQLFFLRPGEEGREEDVLRRNR
jgi:hypothetical protein